MTGSDLLALVPECWRPALAARLRGGALDGLAAFLDSAGRAVLPPRADWFRGLALTAPDAVEVVIVGQDPYHGAGQAHGLAFSVPAGVAPPPSLRNIFREVDRDLGPAPHDGDLSGWTEQGVLLLNTVLTVAPGAAGSHRGRGWEALTDAVLGRVAAGPKPIVFLLWGREAQAKAGLIEAHDARTGHLLLRAPHPSPLSAHRGFIGCGHFSQANAFLRAHHRTPIDWSRAAGPEAG